MLEIGYRSLLYIQFSLLIVAFEKKLCAEDYAAETFNMSNTKSNNDYEYGQAIQISFSL